MPLVQPPPLGSVVFTYNLANGGMTPAMVTQWVAGGQFSNISLAQFGKDGTIRYMNDVAYSATGKSKLTAGFVYNQAGPASALPTAGQTVLYRDPTLDNGIFQGFRRAAIVIKGPDASGGLCDLMLLSPTAGQGLLKKAIPWGPTNSSGAHYEIDKRLLEGTSVSYYVGNGGPAYPAIIVRCLQNTQPGISLCALFVFFKTAFRLTALIQPGDNNTNGVAQYAR